MKYLIVLLLAAYCQARPNIDKLARPALFRPGAGSFVIGGGPADPGEFPWQCSQQRGGGSSWSHSCGCSLLSANRVLTAAHCVDGASPSTLRIVGGLHERSDESNAVASVVESIRMHEDYNDGQATFNNDIGTLTLLENIDANGGTIQYATLPSNNDDLTGQTCVISGWGRVGVSNVLPDTLQKADVTVISEDDCNARISGVSGAEVSPAQICLFDDPDAAIASCNGDSGGPLNCGSGDSRFVAGVTSWGMSSSGNCLTSYPSVYTRTSYFVDWINQGL